MKRIVYADGLCEDIPVVGAVAGEDAANAELDNENTDSEPDGNELDRGVIVDLETDSVEVVTPPEENVGKDGMTAEFEEGANADTVLPKVNNFELEMLATELVLFLPLPGFKLNMLLQTVVEVPNPKLLFSIIEDRSAGANELEEFCPNIDPKENDEGIVVPLLIEPEVPAEVEPKE